MHVLAEMVEVQTQAIQFSQVVLQLLANPRRAIHVGDAFGGMAEVEPVRFPSHESPGGLMVLVRHRHVLMPQVLVVEVDHLELFPGLVGALAQRRQGTPFAARISAASLSPWPAASASRLA